MLDNPLLWIAVAVVVVLLVAVVAIRRSSGGRTGYTGRRRKRPHRNDFRPDETLVEVPRNKAAIIVNPTKVTSLEDFTTRASAVCRSLDWDEPAIVATTVDQTGMTQAVEAIAAGADVVCVLGGDGTVRSVAAGLAGTNTPMGLLPGGTGNLLARNIGLPLDSLESALRIALTGQNQRVDVGQLAIERHHGDTHGNPSPHESPTAPLVDQELFLVMAGLGLDAAIMAGAHDQLKAKVGWPAYLVSGARNLRGDRFKVSVSVGGAAPITKRTRTVVVGNCGKLMAGITLMPEARVDDGILDCVLISPKTLVGWVAVTGRVLRRATASNPRVDHFTSPEFVIRPDRAQEVQVDGDTVGPAASITATVWPRALVIRVPAGFTLPAAPAPDPS